MVLPQAHAACRRQPRGEDRDRLPLARSDHGTVLGSRKVTIHGTGHSGWRVLTTWFVQSARGATAAAAGAEDDPPSPIRPPVGDAGETARAGLSGGSSRLERPPRRKRPPLPLVGRCRGPCVARWREVGAAPRRRVKFAPRFEPFSAGPSFHRVPHCRVGDAFCDQKGLRWRGGRRSTANGNRPVAFHALSSDSLGRCSYRRSR